MKKLFSLSQKEIYLRLAQILIPTYPYLVISVFFLLFVEVFTYHGFIGNYFFISTSFLTLFSFLCSVFLLWRSLEDSTIQKTNEMNFIFQINRLSILPLLFSYYLLQTLEKQHFANYVFSTFHILPENTFTVLLFSFMLLIFDLLQEKKVLNVLKKYRLGLLQLFFFLSVALIVLPQLLGSLIVVYPNTMDILMHLNKSESTKFVQLMNGNDSLGWIYTYGEFIKRQTPEDASVYIPPQKPPWLMEGNPNYFRWFLYPRTLVSAPADEHASIPDGLHYVLLARGSWEWGASEFGWPQLDIPAERIEEIVLINRQTLSEEHYHNQAYIYADHVNNWGIIKLK